MDEAKKLVEQVINTGCDKVIAAEQGHMWTSTAVHMTEWARAKLLALTDAIAAAIVAK